MRLVDSFQRKPFESFIGKSVKYVIASGVTVVLLTTDSYSPLYFAIVSVLNSGLGKLLKKIIQQPRPSLSRKSSFGMPSTHTLAAVYFCFVLYHKLDTVVEDARLRVALYVISTVYTIMACSWRVTSSLHTAQQVFVGGAMGAAAATLAYRCEPAVMAAMEHHTAQVSPYMVALVRFALVMVALPVVFKKELVWLVHTKKKKHAIR